VFRSFGWTLYAVLGVGAHAGPREIRAAFLRRARELHPDVAGADSTRAFQELIEAYAVLRDPVRRREYNQRLDPALVEAMLPAPADAEPPRRSWRRTLVWCPVCAGVGWHGWRRCALCDGDGVVLVEP
jgi:DnaJ-class molecular chaperone